MLRHVYYIFAVMLLLSSCGEGETAAPGLYANLRVSGAQFFIGERPSSTDGPTVISVETHNLVIYPGQPSRKLTGQVDESATAISIAIDKDIGYWVVPVGAPDIYTKKLTYDMNMSFSPSLPTGTVPVIVRAVDSLGRFGPPSALNFKAVSLAVTGAMVLSLSWDNSADLDLHVEQPNGVEIWSKNINAYMPPALGETQAADDIVLGYGILDFDSNAQCISDGRHQENVIWRDWPANGQYLVRVDTYSLCGQASAPWHVEAILDGEVIARASGIATEFDTRFEHQAGAGQLALTLNISENNEQGEE
ncbi:MAG: hypothetical protein JW841_18400 [Deltaproteobacteria bacterium]|nr:hypothetical protein [Deltaproteobacteria bacterium]